MLENEKWYTRGESDKLFAALFPSGFAGEDVLAEIAPEGWSQSTLQFVFHPTVDQVYFEAVQMHKNVTCSGEKQRTPQNRNQRGRRSRQNTKIVRSKLSARCETLSVNVCGTSFPMSTM